jgi:hypothetical protein
MNYEIKIDVTKIDKASLYKGEKGTYMTLQVTETKNNQYGSTHMVKQVLSKERYQAMTEEQRKAIPILGNMSPSKFQPVETVVAEEVKPRTAVPMPDPIPTDDGTSLPF